MVDVGKLLDGLKLSPRYLAPISVATGALLFAPQRFLESLGVASVVAVYRGWIGVAFLITASILATHGALVPWGGVRKVLVTWRTTRARRMRLEDLTPDEKRILLRYIEDNTRTQYLDIKSGVVSGLEDEGIIYRAANMGDLMRGFAYNIQPWAREYLSSHRSLLGISDDTAKGVGGRRVTGR